MSENGDILEAVNDLLRRKRTLEPASHWTPEQVAYISTLTPHQRLTLYAASFPPSYGAIKSYLEHPEHYTDTTDPSFTHRWKNFTYSDPSIRASGWHDAVAHMFYERHMSGTLEKEWSSLYKICVTGSRAEMIAAIDEQIGSLPRRHTIWKDVRVFHQDRYMQRSAPFLSQIATEMDIRPTLTELRRVLSQLDVATWARVMDRYVADLDAILAAAPPLQRSMLVYSSSDYKTKRQRQPGYLLAFYDKESVENDYGEYVHVHRVPAGTPVLPDVIRPRLLLPRNSVAF